MAAGAGASWSCGGVRCAVCGAHGVGARQWVWAVGVWCGSVATCHHHDHLAAGHLGTTTTATTRTQRPAARSPQAAGRRAQQRRCGICGMCHLSCWMLAIGHQTLVAALYAIYIIYTLYTTYQWHYHIPHTTYHILDVVLDLRPTTTCTTYCV
jgi:hypothetical protein